MVFKWTITRPPFQARIDNADVMHPGIETEFETGSIGEAHGIFADNRTELGQMFGAEVMGSASALALNIGESGETETGDQAPAVKRGRGPNKPKPEAVAPAPLAIPGTEAPPTAPGAAPAIVDDGIPEALRRVPAPPPPPAPPAAPPTGVLAGKIAAELDKRATGAADGGQALADWLATSGITVKGATYAEAVTVLRLQADEKLGPIATALGVS
jgi:hypothetical protein